MDSIYPFVQPHPVSDDSLSRLHGGRAACGVSVAHGHNVAEIKFASATQIDKLVHTCTNYSVWAEAFRPLVEG